MAARRRLILMKLWELAAYIGSETQETRALSPAGPIEIAILVTGDTKSAVAADMFLPRLNNCAPTGLDVCCGSL